MMKLVKSGSFLLAVTVTMATILSLALVQGSAAKTLPSAAMQKTNTPNASEKSVVQALQMLWDRHGLDSSDLVGIGLTSAELQELGVDDVVQRVNTLKWLNNARGGTAGVPLQEFSFAVSHFNTTRQYGKCINVIVKYRYPTSNEPVSFDYRDVHQLVLAYAMPSTDFPMVTRWEDVNLAMTRDILGRFNITSISSQFQVMSMKNQYIDEPGNHGSTITIGEIPALAEPLANAFSYNCVNQTGP